ncbi:MAG: tetratricopeptide repeat protein [Desulfovibrionaceae bacterium]|jgi:tetratricopeptide (TPR) repeat protein
MEQIEKQIRIKGFFSRRSSPGKKAKEYFFAKESAEGSLKIRLLDENFTPRGEQTTLGKDAFLKRYMLEPELWYKCVTGRLVRGDAYRRSLRHEEASKEYQRALEVDEENIRAMYGLGLCYLALKDLKKASYVFEQLVALDESFEEHHKHLFNEFGISLRKQGMFEEARRYYSRALDLAPSDEHLSINLARTEFESGNVEAAYSNLRRAFEINPDHPCVLAFLKHLQKQGVQPQDEACAEALRDVLKKALSTRIRLEDLGC